MNIPKDGSRWIGQGSYEVFLVLHTIELNGHTWVHYRNDNNGEREYSCYIDSFLERFKEVGY
jgi:hypothetical protein